MIQQFWVELPSTARIATGVVGGVIMLICLQVLL